MKVPATETADPSAPLLAWRGIPRLYTAAPENAFRLLEIEQAAVVWQGERLLWCGRDDAVPAAYAGAASRLIDRGVVVPGLIDCHTHLPFAGSRFDEVEWRLLGADYLEILAAGGGIRRSVEAVRGASEEDLVALCAARLARLARLGVTTVEAKSGYGLSLDHELKQLRAVKQAAAGTPQQIVSTFLGAHVVPAEWREDRARYISALTEEMIPAVAEQGLAEFCDVFVEEGAFSRGEARMILGRAAQVGLTAKLHVDQLHEGGGGELAEEVGAISADHLEHLSPAGIDAMARCGAVAVSLPLATLFLRQPAMPARSLLARGVPVAVATDWNPGTAPSCNLPGALTLACVMQAMSAAEALLGATIHAARAVGREQRSGSILAGKRADLVWVDAPDLGSWILSLPEDSVLMTVAGGQSVFSRADVGQ